MRGFKPLVPKINTFNFDNQDAVQDFNQRQIYTKGFQFNPQTGVNEFPCVLGGKARVLHGICVYSELPADNDIVSLNINSELVVDNVLWKTYNPEGQSGNIYKSDQYFKLTRSLSGSDSVQLNWNALNAKKIWIVFYLSNK